MKHVAIIYVLTFSFINLSAQDAKQYFNNGIKDKEQRQFEAAIVNFTQAILLKEKFEDAYIQRADCFTKFYKYSEAANDYKKLSELFPKNEEYLKSAGKLFLKASDFASAARFLEAYHKSRESDETIIPELIEAKNGRGLFTDALNYCNKFEKIFSDNCIFLFGKYKATKGVSPAGNYYPELQKGYEKMLASIEYTKNPSRYHSYLLEYSEGLIGLKKYDEAIFLLRTITKNEANNSKYFFDRSMIYYSQQKYDSALFEIQGAFKLSKTNAKYYIHRGIS